MWIRQIKIARLAFTLIELLATVAIVGILVALLLPAIQAVRESSRRIDCGNNCRQVGIALHLFEGSHAKLPPTISGTLLHWHAFILPYVEQATMYDSIFAAAELGISPYMMPERITNVVSYQCRSNPNRGLIIRPNSSPLFAYSDYTGVAGVTSKASDGIFIADLSLLADRNWKGISFNEVKDGLSNTLMFGERPPSVAGEGFGAWLGSQNSNAATIGVVEDIKSIGLPNLTVNCNYDGLGFQQGSDDLCSWVHHWSYHAGGANFTRADGSVHFVSYSIEREVIAALATRSGGEIEVSD
jgi:prepilin-type N-terminal cleavage/methylation domain-containing protein/prepilin-type processing-associated H-X9-DG protein